MTDKNKKSKDEISEVKTVKTEPVVAENATEPAQEAPLKSQEGRIIINDLKDDRARWYVVHTYSAQEGRVAETLRQRVESMSLTDKVLEILVPVQNKIVIRSGAKHEIKERIFPGYLMVKMILTDQSWLAVRTTPGVTGFVGVGDKPTPLENKEIDAIEKFASQEAPKFKAKFSIGEAVRIVDGPFSDFLGSVNEIDETRGKLKVLVSIFGRETPVELDFLQVSKI